MGTTKFLILLPVLAMHSTVCMSLAEYMGLSDSEIQATVNKKVLGGQTPLYTAVRRNNAESEGIIRRLVALKADPDCSGGRGWTPLRHSANQGKQEMVDLLIELKANVHEEGLRPDGTRVNSLLSDILPDDHVGIARSLISAGADIGIGAGESNAEIGSRAQVQVRQAQVRVEQCSILEEALRRRALKIAKLLVAAGSDVRRINQDGDGVIDLAVVSGDAQLAQLVIDKGGYPDFQTVLSAIQTGNPKKIQIVSHAYRTGQRRKEMVRRISQEEFLDSALEYGFIGAAWVAVLLVSWNLAACVWA